MVFNPPKFQPPTALPYLHKSIMLSLLLLLAGCTADTSSTLLPWLAVVLLVVLAAAGLFFRHQLRTAADQQEYDKRTFDQRYRHLFTNALECMLITNDNGRYLDANPAACDLLGYTLEELLSKHIWDIDAFDDKKTVQNAYDQFIQAGTMLGTSTLRCRDGRLIETEYQAVANFMPGRHLISFRDITQRKATETQLRKSEEKFRTLFEMLPDALFLADAKEGTIVDVNPAAVRLIGKPYDEIVGMHQTALHPPEQLSRAQETFARRSTNPNTYQTPPVEIDVLVNDDLRTVEIRGRKFTVQGQECILGVFRDISERKQAEARLQESEERYRLLFENAGLGIFYFAPDGMVLACNEIAASFFNSRPEDLISHHLQEAQPGPISDLVIERISQSVQTGQPTTYETELDLPAGERHLLSTYTPIRHACGRIAGVQIISHDVTDRVQSTQALLLSEKMLRVTLDAIQESVFLISTEGAIVECNQTAIELSGKTREEFLGTSIFALVDETVQVDDPNFQQQTLAMDEPTTITVRQHGRIYECTLYPIVANDGQMSHAAIYAQDVTTARTAAAERESLLTQIQAQSEIVSGIVKSLPEGIILLDEQRRLVMANPVAHRLLRQLDQPQAHGTLLNQLGPLTLSSMLTQSQAEPERQEFTYKEQTLLLTAQRLTATTNDAGWILLLKDITIQKEQEQIRQQQERLAAVGQLAAGIAHDFNNLLAVIVLYTEMMLMEKWLPSEMADRLRTILTQTSKATTLVQQILDFGRRAIMHKEPLAVMPFMEKTVALLQRTLPENITISLAGDDNSIAILADAKRLEQMLINMALNARDAMPQGGRLDIRLSRWQQKETASLSPSKSLRRGEWLQLTISDNGSGIDPEIQPRIFEPFFTTRAPLGHGLGLSQVYGIIKQHEGEIDLHSVPGEGTTFNIFLPAVKQTPPPVTELKPASDVIDNGRQQTILLVEDDEAALETIADILRDLNYQVITAANGRDALDRYHEHQTEIDLVLSDMIMPHLGGPELFYALRAEDPHLKMIMLTGYSQRHALQSLVADGLAGWLEKPPRLEALSTLIAQILDDEP